MEEFDQLSEKMDHFQSLLEVAYFKSINTPDESQAEEILEMFIRLRESLEDGELIQAKMLQKDLAEIIASYGTIGVKILKVIELILENL